MSKEFEFKGFGRPPEQFGKITYTLILEHRPTGERFHVPVPVSKAANMILTDQKARVRADLICQYLVSPTEDITNECLADVMGQDVVDQLSDDVLEALENVEWKGNLYASMRLKAKRKLFYNIEPVQAGVVYDDWRLLAPAKSHADAIKLEIGAGGLMGVPR